MTGSTDRSEAVLAILRLAPVVPVLTVHGPDDGVPLAAALTDGGLPAIEVTLRTPGAMAAIEAIARAVPGARVGAGTVTSAAQAREAIAAGACFLVSPGATRSLAQAALSWSVPLLPGAATASEAMELAELGYHVLKFFPAEPAGGVAYLKALAGPLPQLRFCPTGGIDLAAAPRYLALPNVVCVGGSWVTPPAAVAAKDWAQVSRLAREAAALAKR
jgi:2-dehydro-3-deoxyphosphogluconate aldolase / (4S)-4-hydroxy-2-oxoglutarate aldolase